MTLHFNNVARGLVCSITLLLAHTAMPTNSNGMVQIYRCDSLSDAKKDLGIAAKYTSIALVAATAFRFFTRQPDNTHSRYNWDKLAQGCDMPKQLFYVWDDGIVGHPGAKSFDEVNKENNRIERTPAAYARGLGGQMATYYKPVLSVLGVTWVIVTAVKVMSLPDTTAANFVTRLTNEIELRIKQLGCDPSLENIAPALAGIVGYKLASSGK